MTFSPFKQLSPLFLAFLLAACASTPPPPPPAPSPDAAAAPSTEAPTALPAPAIAPLPVALAASEPESNADAAEIEDSLNPGVKVQLDDAAAKADLWDRVRAGFAMPTLSNDGVARAEGWYAARPDYVQRMTERGSRYLYHIVKECEKRGLPTELALLPFVESAFNTQAQSSAKASGLWQFVPATGRDFDLKQNIFRDDRRDVLASTSAALDYLAQLYKQFGDWQLALAAYNWGQGNVARAVAHNQRRGLPTNYESLKLPEETAYYVPKLQAVKNIVMDPAAYGLTLPPMENHPYFLSVKIERDMDVALAAKLAGMSEDDFRQFNPQMNKPVILANGTDQLLLPYDNAGAFATNLAAHHGPLATWTAWVVPRTMKPADAARQAGMSEKQLREINKIPPRMLVRRGSTLLVPRSAKHEQDVSEHLADTASISLAPDRPPLRRMTIKARKGETVATLARRYHVSSAEVAHWNNVGSRARFRTGQRLVVYTASPAPHVARKPTARHRTKTARGAGHAVIVARDGDPVRR